MRENCWCWPATRIAAHTRIETNLTLTALANKYKGKRLNSPNDLVYNSNGDLYFTDPPYGLMGQNDSPSKELPFNGVYRLTPNGELTLLIKDLIWPNGIALSPDKKTLYVSNADAKKAVWMAYPVKPDGTLGKGRVFSSITSKAALDSKKGCPTAWKWTGMETFSPPARVACMYSILPANIWA